MSILFKLGKNLLLLSSTESLGFIRLSHDLVSVGSKLAIEALDNTGLVVGILSGMELLEVLGSDGSEFLGFNLTSGGESFTGTNLKFAFVFSYLFVNDNESHFTFLHLSFTAMSNLHDVTSISLLVGSVNNVDLTSVDLSSGYCFTLEGLELGGALRLTTVFSEVNVLLNFCDVMGRLLDPVIFLDVSSSFLMVVVLVDNHVLFAVVRSVCISGFSSLVSLLNTLIVSKSTFLLSVSASISSSSLNGHFTSLSNLCSLSSQFDAFNNLCLLESSFLDHFGVGSDGCSLCSSLGHHNHFDFVCFSRSSLSFSFHFVLLLDG